MTAKILKTPRPLFVVDGRAIRPLLDVTYGYSVRWRLREVAPHPDTAGNLWRNYAHTGEACLHVRGQRFFFQNENQRVVERHGREVVYITTGGVSEAAMNTYPHWDIRLHEPLCATGYAADYIAIWTAQRLRVALREAAASVTKRAAAMFGLPTTAIQITDERDETTVRATVTVEI